MESDSEYISQDFPHHLCFKVSLFFSFYYTAHKLLPQIEKKMNSQEFYSLYCWSDRNHFGGTDPEQVSSETLINPIRNFSFIMVNMKQGIFCLKVYQLFSKQNQKEKETKQNKTEKEDYYPIDCPANQYLINFYSLHFLSSLIA